MGRSDLSVTARSARSSEPRRSRAARSRREACARGRAGASSRTAAGPGATSLDRGVERPAWPCRGLMPSASIDRAQRRARRRVHSHVSRCAIDRVEDLADALGRLDASPTTRARSRTRRRRRRGTPSGRRAATSVAARSCPIAHRRRRRPRGRGGRRTARGAIGSTRGRELVEREPADLLAVQPVELLVVEDRGRRASPGRGRTRRPARRASSTSRPSSAGAQPSSAR